MHLLYCDETNLQERAGDFFVYAGIVVGADRSRDLSHRVDSIRAAAGVPTNYRLKFNPGPDCLDHRQFIELKKAIVAAAVEAKVGLLVSANRQCRTEGGAGSYRSRSTCCGKRAN